MNGFKGTAAFAIAGLAASTAVIQPAHAAQTEITDLRLSPTANGVQLDLQVRGNSRPPIFSVNRGNSTIVDISNSQLRLVSGNSFSESEPTAGLRRLQVSQLDANTVRIVVEGEGTAPILDITRREATNGILVMSFERGAELTAAGDRPSLGAQEAPSGQSANPVPPNRPRASAPPVGDISVGAINADPERIELGSAQIIPKLLLRDAPAREVLTLLGRASGLNVAFAESGEAEGGPTISLDIENESVDDVFNYVIRLTGLQANRVGQTVFVGKELPGDAQNRVVRTLRLNQMRATAKTTYSTSIQTEAQTGGNVSSDSDSGATAETAINRSTVTEDQIEGTGAKEILESYGANGGQGGSTLLTGLEAVADSRTNSITLIGTPRKVEIASQLLTQLDVRKRQVAVNVKFVDVNLLNGKLSNADLQFRANDNLGIGVLNNGAGRAFGAIFGSGAAVLSPANVVTTLTDTFIGTIFAEVTNNNAKILTNPTLMVQEGSSAQVNLTEQIFSGFEVTDTSDASASGAETRSQTRKPIIQNAGVILNVTVDRIDDNGFVSLSLSPEVSSPSGRSFEDGGSEALLLQQRRLETGMVRLRDGQTMVLTGIIRDQDRVDISKVPILGDIPLLGRLFRDENKTRERSELVVLVTPQILDDSDQSTFGYQYRPSPGVAPTLRRP
ncbi:AMIN domain-containing protein [Lyngbya confervoides]|uniref:AMIN domain-containing protein n=1 Tax=Lyngbya confervoides BDU141951 TaxID=1574623 RepID=A0ABD4SYV3_9CYAN|nr:AMIN domain-containing protein [Lyngbya confervoides]MCM1981280.1 AMIN domain-containing protein [Lyngbya confervoides BDU141951]